MSNEVIYGLLVCSVFSFGLYKLLYTKRTTDYDDYKVMQAYFLAKRKGLIK